MSFPRYPEYKDSGVEWLGQVPAHWQIVALGRTTLARCDGPFGSGLKSEHYVDAGVRVVRLQNIRGARFDDTDAAFVAPSYFERELGGHDVVEGDLLIAGLGDENNAVGRACVAPQGIEPAMVKADCFRFRLDLSQLLPPYAAHVLTSSSGADAGRLATGSTRSRIPLSVMASRRLPMPPLAEQQAIADFLGRETAKIDALVAEQERLIELLKEKRQAVISHAVTKGLDPSVPMKDSGVEWIGEIPAHWSLCSLGRLGEFKGGAGFPDHEQGLSDQELPFYKVGDLARAAGDGRLHHAENTVSRDTANRLRARVFPAGTIAFAKVGAALLLQRYRWLAEPACLDNNLMGLLLGDGVDREFLLGVLPLLDLSLIANPGAVPSINAGQIARQRIALPPLAEQLTVADFFARESQAIQELTETCAQAIALLQERRAALISAAVTGEIDVRGAAA